MPRHNYGGPAPTDAGSVPADVNDLKRDFARRLHSARIEKGWNQADLARAAAKYMADKKFGRDLVGPYERAERLPSPVHLSAMARALGKEPRELLPYQGVPGSEINRSTAVDVKDVGEGRAWIRINKQVPWDVAMQIMRLLNPETTPRG